MNDKREPIDPQTLNREVQAIWDKNAAFWDEAMGEGNQFQRILIGPAAERLLALNPGELVLDVACGNGVFARRMAQIGAQVIACDFSANFIEIASQRTSEYATRIEYEIIDATDREQLLGLGARRFDAIYCGMAFQDMTDIEPLFSAAAELLKPGGRFVFSIPHPAFNNSGIRKIIEEEDREGELVVQYAIKVTDYIHTRTDKGLGIIGQPAAQFYFHRPISLFYKTASGMALSWMALKSPFLNPEKRAIGLSPGPISYIPPVLVSRLSLPAGQG